MTYSLAVFCFGVWCGLNDDKVIKWLAEKWAKFTNKWGLFPRG